MRAPIKHVGLYGSASGPRDPMLCLEHDVENIDIASAARPTAYGAAHETVQQDGSLYAPTDFLRRFALVIAVCLGMALMAHVLAIAGG